MKGKRVPVNLIVALCVLLLFGIALLFRILFPYETVFGGEIVKFTSVDAYFHMRLVDNLAHNFPNLVQFDPYFLYPGGGDLTRIHFFDWLLAAIIWVAGFGSPSPELIDVIGAYYPVVLGSLTVIPVFFIGKALLNRWAGLLASGLIAVMPGEYIGRTILGFTDNPAAEVLFTTATMLFLILAVKEGRQRGLSLSHMLKWDRPSLTRPLVFALLAGLFLGIYLISWAGALLFIFVIAVFLVIQFIIDHLRRRSTDYLGITGFAVFILALLVFLPSSPSLLHSASLIIAALIPLALSAVSRLATRLGMRPFVYPCSLVIAAAAGVGIVYLLSPSLLDSMLRQFSIFRPVGISAITTLEMGPLLRPYGEWTTAAAWGNFTLGFYLSFITIGILVYLAIKRGDAEKTLLLVWSVIIFMAAFGQRRFAYYYAVDVALLTGILSWLFLKLVMLLADWFHGYTGGQGFRLRLAGIVEMDSSSNKLAETAKEIKDNSKYGTKGKKGEDIYTAKYIFVILASLAVFFFVFLGNINYSKKVAMSASYAVTDGWLEALTWVRDNTPEPFGDPDYYYEYYEASADGEGYQYPESAYGVTSWWDYGYWITRIAHRIPNANPGQASGPVTDVANLLLGDGTTAPDEELVEKLRSEYLVIDDTVTVSKFWAMVVSAGMDVSEFQETYYYYYDNQMVPLTFYKPRYYQTLCSRLYNFDGQAVTPDYVMVVKYDVKISRTGQRYKQIVDVEEFADYAAALEYFEKQDEDTADIVGGNPFDCPIPLEAVEDYKLVFASDTSIEVGDGSFVPEVKVFEYIKP